MEKSNRFYEIDFLRFFAALSVIAYHYTFQGFAVKNMSVAYPFFEPISKYGYMGVNLFFIISGFVILKSAYKKSAKHFLISRMVRLYPAFWVSCTLTFLALVTIGKIQLPEILREYVLNLTMLGDFIGVKPIDSVYWSLFYEIRFYFFIFILLIIGKIDRIKYFLGLWLALSYLFFAINPKHFQYLLMPDYSAYFIAGAAFFLINSEGLDLYKALLLIGSYLLSLFNATKYIKFISGHYKTHFDFSVMAIFITIFYLIFYLISTNRTKRIGSEKFIVIGLLTYPIYLLHQNIGFMLFKISYPLLNKYVLLLFIFSFMLLLSYIISSKVEKALSGRLKKRLEKILDGIEYYFSALRHSLETGTSEEDNHS